MTLTPEHKTGLTEAPRTALVIMGMRGSGTSAFAGTLSFLGVDLPRDLGSPGSSIETGSFESHSIRRLQDRFLGSAGMSWNSFLTTDPEWLEWDQARKFEEELLQLAIDQFDMSPLFVLKDPWICHLAPIWIRILARLGARPAILHIHRDPTDVAMSLERRSRIEPPSGLLAWLRHALNAEFFTRGQPRYFTSYERLLGGWPKVVSGIKEAFRIDLPHWNAESSRQVNDFLSTLPRGFQDRSITGDASQSSYWIGTVHTIFERWAERGEDAQDFAALDEIRSEFNVACKAFAPLIERPQGSWLEDAQLLSRDGKEQARRGANLIEPAGHDACESSLDLGQQATEGARETARRAADERRWEIQQANLAERALQIRKLERQLEDRFNELGEITRRLIDRETELLRSRVKATEDQLRAVQHAHNTLLRAHDNLQRAQNSLQNTYKVLQRDYKVLQLAHNDVLASTSWRVTQPLRRVIGTLRR